MITYCILCSVDLTSDDRLARLPLFQKKVSVISIQKDHYCSIKMYKRHNNC